MRLFGLIHADSQRAEALQGVVSSDAWSQQVALSVAAPSDSVVLHPARLLFLLNILNPLGRRNLRDAEEE